MVKLWRKHRAIKYIPGIVLIIEKIIPYSTKSTLNGKADGS